ncbi:MAG TPA: toprim domain-containing protein, partial [Pseudolabrys sp.]
PAIAIPESVTDLVLLGDGDSDPFTTMTTMRRAEARYARPGLHIRVAMAPAGQDFNDVWMSAGVAAPASGVEHQGAAA